MFRADNIEKFFFSSLKSLPAIKRRKANQWTVRLFEILSLYGFSAEVRVSF